MRVRGVWLLAIAGFITIGSASSSAQGGGVVSGTVVAPQNTYKGQVGGEDHPVRVSGGVMAGLMLDQIQPEYPQDAKDEKIAGAVVMMAKVDKAGKVVDLKAISGPEKLRDAALTAVRQWTYKPYLLNGQPVFVQTTVTVNFSLAK